MGVNKVCTGANNIVVKKLASLGNFTMEAVAKRRAEAMEAREAGENNIQWVLGG